MRKIFETTACRFWCRIYINTNPPRKTHWIQKLELANHQRIKVFHRPPALLKNDNNQWVINEDADNLKFITKQYYLDMIQNGDEFVNVTRAAGTALSNNGLLFIRTTMMNCIQSKRLILTKMKLFIWVLTTVLFVRRF